MPKKKQPNKNAVNRPTPGGEGLGDGIFSSAEFDRSASSVQKITRELKSANLSAEEYNKMLDKRSSMQDSMIEKTKQEKAIILDMSQMYDDMAAKQFEQTKSVEQLYGIQNKLADKLKLSEGFALEIANSQRETRDMSLQESIANQRLTRELQTLNRLKLV